jgi:transcriptional regulator with XRE-family HTH domain
MARKLLLSEQLRRLIESNELTRYRMSQETGVSEPTLSRFVNGRGGMSWDSIDTIGELLDLEIRKRPKQTRKGK